MPAATRALEIDAGRNAGAVLGGFVINLVGPVVENGVEKTPAFTAVFGTIFDRATPAPVAWKIVAEGGGCQLLTPLVPFCSAGCGGGAACVEGGTCVEYPSAVSLGRVHVKGLAGGEFDMEEVAGNYRPPPRFPIRPCPKAARSNHRARRGARAAAPGKRRHRAARDSRRRSSRSRASRSCSPGNRPRRPPSAASRSRWTSAITAAARATSSATSPTPAASPLPPRRSRAARTRHLRFSHRLVTRVASAGTATRLRPGHLAGGRQRRARGRDRRPALVHGKPIAPA